MSRNDADSSHDRDSVERRLAAVERALTENEDIDRTTRLDDLDERVTELEAAVQALRGYVGSVRAVNDDIEHRADLALRKAAALERHVGAVPETLEHEGDGDTRGTQTETDDDGGVLAALRR
ncbi:MAG: hypothetical protein ACI8UR_000402 [Natronomonas sp.]|jgi:hypothetical protein|uniref:DUF7310 family coiled-coil domain-containing protein n=1 Tax=Natronomonas sp. TaxID=2184060 RepID=UPI0039895A7F